jgi:hypothetical protein
MRQQRSDDNEEEEKEEEEEEEEEGVEAAANADCDHDTNDVTSIEHLPTRTFRRSTTSLMTLNDSLLIRNKRRS